MFVQMILEDVILNATRFDANRQENAILAKDGKPAPAAGWHVQVRDGFSGMTHSAVWTDQQMSAISALAHGIGEEQETPASVSDYLYSIAEPALAGFPKECRCIP